MRTLLPIVVLMLTGGLCACGRQSLFAKQSIPVLAPPASAATPPRFVGRWTTASDGQCKDPWVIQARSLSENGVNCDFVQVDTSSAGYSVSTICHAGDGGPQPGRLNVIMPEQIKAATLTVSGSAVGDAVALQRCGG